MHKKNQINKQKSYHQFDLIACAPFISVWFCRFVGSYLLLSFSHTFLFGFINEDIPRADLKKKSHTLNFVGFERSPRTFSDGSESPNVKWVCFYLRRFFISSEFLLCIFLPWIWQYLFDVCIWGIFGWIWYDLLGLCNGEKRLDHK